MWSQASGLATCSCGKHTDDKFKYWNSAADPKVCAECPSEGAAVCDGVKVVSCGTAGWYVKTGDLLCEKKCAAADQGAANTLVGDACKCAEGHKKASSGANTTCTKCAPFDNVKVNSAQDTCECMTNYGPAFVADDAKSCATKLLTNQKFKDGSRDTVICEGDFIGAKCDVSCKMAKSTIADGEAGIKTETCACKAD